MMKGLYILETSKLKKDNTLKIGMSEKLENRWRQYISVFSDAYYLYCYETPELNKKDILYLESLILKETKSLRNMDYQTEYRIMEYNTLHKIIITYLEDYNVNYEIHENPIFNKSKIKIFDSEFFEEYDFEEISINPTKKFKNIKPKNEITIDDTKKVTNMLETQGFNDVEFIDNNRIIANKNNDLYIFKKRNSTTIQNSYNIFTYHDKISEHYFEILNSLKDKKYNSMHYCFLVVYTDINNNKEYYLVELTNINPIYRIENIGNGSCDGMITVKKENMQKYVDIS